MKRGREAERKGGTRKGTGGDENVKEDWRQKDVRRLGDQDKDEYSG